MKLTARSKGGIYRQLTEFYKQLHAEGFNNTADKVYKLSQDTLFDNYLEPRAIHQKFFKIMSNSEEIK
jgi:NAD-dependent SIR2 family protein deacetylase